MALGKGEYDDLCTYVREHAGPHAGALVVVLNGDRALSSGFSCQMTGPQLVVLVEMLRHCADAIERDGPFK